MISFNIFTTPIEEMHDIRATYAKIDIRYNVFCTYLFYVLFTENICKYFYEK